jgi:hypothetical protein
MAAASKQSLPPIVLAGSASLRPKKARLPQRLQCAIFKFNSIIFQANDVDSLCWHLCRLQQLTLRGCCRRHPRQCLPP